MKTFKVVAAVVATLVTGSAQAGFIGTFYDTCGVQDPDTCTPVTTTMTEVEAFLATNPSPDATFNSTGIDYGGPAPYVFTDLDAFLGVDAASLDPLAEGATSLLGSVITLTGTIYLDPGINVFDVFSDDVFSLIIDGIEIGSFEGLRAPSSSIINYDAGAGGLAAFELLWFEGSETQAALNVNLNGEIITAVLEPGTLALFGIGLLGLHLARRGKV